MRVFFIIFLVLIININIFTKEGFFLQNRSGALIKIDFMSGLKQNNPIKKGPTLDDIKNKIEKNEFEKEILEKLVEKIDRDFFKMVYELKDDGYYYLKESIILSNFDSRLLKNHIMLNITPDEKIFLKNYKLNNKTKIYFLKENIDKDKSLEISKNAIRFILRVILLDLNKDNEMYTGIDTEGTPMPHKFPRVFEAKSKGYFDIHFVWGYRFNDIIVDNVNYGAVTLGFSINLTNIVMPSLEIMVKYNFNLGSKYPFFEPFVGGLIYGGFIDGFPIGISALGGCDVFPKAMENDFNFYLSAEMRLGGVLYSKIYFDTGKNNEGIWKKFDFLLESGFYFGAGYRWDKK